MPSQVSSPTYIIGGAGLNQDSFWTKMTTALSITQLMIGISCVAFHVTAFYIDKSVNQPLHYIGEGLLTGGVIIVACIFGFASSKKKSNCSIITFLVLSVLAGLFALFPMVFGIMGASMVFGETSSLMMPISQLVLATVEIIVATWSIGVCSQALCCPNSALAQSANRMMGGGLTQFVASGDGQHVVIFSAGPHHPPMMYAGHDGAMPYLVQGMQGVQYANLGTVSAAGTQTCSPDLETAQDLASMATSNTAGGSGPLQNASGLKPGEKREEDEKMKLLEEEVEDDDDDEDDEEELVMEEAAAIPIPASRIPAPAAAALKCHSPPRLSPPHHAPRPVVHNVPIPNITIPDVTDPVAPPPSDLPSTDLPATDMPFETEDEEAHLLGE